MFVNANDFRENNFFSVFVYILGKCSEKYSTLCVWSSVKQNNKNSHKKPPESTTTTPNNKTKI
jgi:hypothetical protein